MFRFRMTHIQEHNRTSSDNVIRRLQDYTAMYYIRYPNQTQFVLSTYMCGM
jgi:hypothetical protein